MHCVTPLQPQHLRHADHSHTCSHQQISVAVLLDSFLTSKSEKEQELQVCCIVKPLPRSRDLSFRSWRILVTYQTQSLTVLRRTLLCNRPLFIVCYAVRRVLMCRSTLESASEMNCGLIIRTGAQAKDLCCCSPTLYTPTGEVPEGAGGSEHDQDIA